MRRLWIASLLTAGLLFTGCTYAVQHTGDSQFLRTNGELKWERGKTTAAEVARVLGPPDRITTWGDDLWFHYAYNHVTTSSLVLKYYGNWFTKDDKVAIDRELTVAFDGQDKLLYHAMSRGPLDRKLLGLEY